MFFGRLWSEMSQRVILDTGVSSKKIADRLSKNLVKYCESDRLG
ncbi:hypothetical protein APA_522 [Pseudanabaena sp. lw0831]|nr:hypothetical protein APA_522 [Pseudanabaena sp. lw0831]